MEKRLRRIEIGLAILLILSIVNLGTSFYSDKDLDLADEDSIAENKELPDDLSRDKTNKIVFRIKNAFNESNWYEMHDIFGELAKAQISVEDIKKEFDKLKPVMGNIETYAISHHVYEGNSSNADWFEIHYKCRFANGKGTIKLSTRTVDDVSEVVGVNIKLDSI